MKCYAWNLFWNIFYPDDDDDATWWTRQGKKSWRIRTLGPFICHFATTGSRPLCSQPFKGFINTIYNPFNNYLMSQSRLFRTMMMWAIDMLAWTRNQFNTVCTTTIHQPKDRKRELFRLIFRFCPIHQFRLHAPRIILIAIIATHPHTRVNFISHPLLYCSGPGRIIWKIDRFFCCPHKYRNLFVFNLLRITRMVSDRLHTHNIRGTFTCILLLCSLQDIWFRWMEKTWIYSYICCKE